MLKITLTEEKETYAKQRLTSVSLQKSALWSCWSSGWGSLWGAEMQLRDTAKCKMENNQITSLFFQILSCTSTSFVDAVALSWTDWCIKWCSSTGNWWQPNQVPKLPDEWPDCQGMALTVICYHSGLAGSYTFKLGIPGLDIGLFFFQLPFYIKSVKGAPLWYVRSKKKQCAFMVSSSNSGNISSQLPWRKEKSEVRPSRWILLVYVSSWNKFHALNPELELSSFTLLARTNAFVSFYKCLCRQKWPALRTAII